MKCALLAASAVFALTLFAPNCASAGDGFQFDTFEAMIGLDDGCLGRPGNAVFKVLLDGREVFKSEVMRPGEPPKYIAIPLEDARGLTLIVDDVGDGHGGDWGNWADARLTDNETGSVLFLSDLDAVVEKRWIDTKMDRNIIEEPLKMAGKVYARGLGAISGSQMTYSGWNEYHLEKKARLLNADRKGLRKLRKVALNGTLPEGVVLRVNGQVVKTTDASVNLRLSRGDRIELSMGTRRGENLLDGPAFKSLGVRCGRGRWFLPLSELLPSEIVHVFPAHASLSEVDEVVLNGRRYFATIGTGHEVTVVYESLPSQAYHHSEMSRALEKRKSEDLSFLCIYGVESPEENPYATAIFTVKLDGETVYRSGLVSPSSRPEIISVPLGRAAELTLEVDDFGDGRYQDNVAWADAALVEVVRGRLLSHNVETGEQFPLSSFVPYVSKSGYKKAGVDFSAKGEFIRLGGRRYDLGFGVYAPSRIQFKDIKEMMEKRRAAQDEMRRAEKAISDGGDVLSVEKYILKAREMDDTVSGIYPLLARIEEMKGNVQASIDAWERVVDVSHATRGEKRMARHEIDRLYEKGGYVRSERSPRNQPPSFSHNIPIGRGEGELFTVVVGTPYRAEGRKEVLLPGSFVIDVDESRAGKYCTLLVNSGGLKPLLRTAKSEAVEGKPVADFESFSIPLPSRNDFVYEWRLEKGTHTIYVDYSRTNGYDDTCSFYMVYSLSDEPGGRSAEEWEYRISANGIVDVECTLTGNGMVLVPHTAEEVEVKGASTYICYPLYQYGSRLDHPFNMGKILMVAPKQEKAIVTFRWPDGAYNVPMTKYGGERKETFYFQSIRGINPDVEEVKVSVMVPEDTGEVKRLVPADPEIDLLTYRWTVPWDKTVRLDAKYPRLDTKWLKEKYRSMTVNLPDNPYNRRWLPEYMSMLKRIYDRESFVMDGYEPDTETFVYLTGAAQLSGFGGATWGGKNSETWFGSTGRIGEYHLRYQPGGNGVEAHELKWVFLAGTVKSLPRWLHQGTVIWLEEQGKYAGNLAFPDYWTHTELIPKSQRHVDSFMKRSAGYVRLEEDDFNRLNNEEKRTGNAMAWHIQEWLHKEYGEEFWPSFWKLQRRNPVAYANLDPRSRTIKAIEDMVAVTGDKGLRKPFERWGFDLRPDPQYSPKYFARLPRKWAFREGDDPSWREVGLDDLSWERINVGASWEEVSKYKEYDGFAWYRLKFKWPSALKTDNLYLELGKIDDSDEAYFNGEKIGATGSMPPEYASAWTLTRRYRIPKRLIRKNSENVIAVRVYDGGGGGGIYDRTPGIVSSIKRGG